MASIILQWAYANRFEGDWKSLEMVKALSQSDDFHNAFRFVERQKKKEISEAILIVLYMETLDVLPIKGHSGYHFTSCKFSVVYVPLFSWSFLLLRYGVHWAILISALKLYLKCSKKVSSTFIKIQWWCFCEKINSRRKYCDGEASILSTSWIH